MEQNADQVAAKTIEGNRDGAELERNHYDDKKNGGQQAALKEETAKRQRAHLCPLIAQRSSEEMAREESAGARGFVFSLLLSGFSLNASGCSCRARSSTAEMSRGAGRLMASPIVA